MSIATAHSQQQATTWLAGRGAAAANQVSHFLSSQLQLAQVLEP